jgi:hypothetical protein
VRMCWRVLSPSGPRTVAVQSSWVSEKVNMSLVGVVVLPLTLPCFPFDGGLLSAMRLRISRVVSPLRVAAMRSACRAGSHRAMRMALS